MIHPKIIAEARRLLAEGNLSQRTIATKVGISRASVGSIANGKRPDYPLKDKDPVPGIDPYALKSRCLGCGAKVIMPCITCRDRRALAGAKRLPVGIGDSPGELDFELRPKHRERLEEVRRARAANPQPPIPNPSRKAPADQDKWWYIDGNQLARALEVCNLA